MGGQLGLQRQGLLLLHPAAVVGHAEEERALLQTALHADLELHPAAEAVLDAVFQQRLKKELGHHAVHALRRDVQLAAEAAAKADLLDVEIALYVENVVLEGHLVPRKINAVPQDLGQLGDDLLRLYAVKESQGPDDLQCIVQKVGVHLGGELLHLDAVAPPQQLGVALVELLEGVQHIVGLMGHLAELVAAVHLDSVPGVGGADIPELLHQMLHAGGAAGGHAGEDVPRRHIPGRSGHGQGDEAGDELAAAGVVDERVDDRAAVRGGLAEGPVPQAVELHRAVAGAAEFVVHRGKGMFAAVHNVAPEIGDHAVKVGVGQGVVPPGPGEIEGQKAQEGGVLIDRLDKHAVGVGAVVVIDGAVDLVLPAVPRMVADGGVVVP